MLSREWNPCYAYRDVFPGNDDAIGDDRIGPHGWQHGAAADSGRARGHRVRPERRCRQGARRQRRESREGSRRCRQAIDAAPDRLGDAAGRGRSRRHHRAARGAALPGRHRHRWRQLELPGLTAPGRGAHVRPAGAGHYVKMVHNGIEYGMLQAYAEGYEILHASKDFTLDLGKIAKLWNRGSVVRSWLNELAERAFSGDQQLAGIKGYVEDSGEGRWTVDEAMRLNVPAPVITLSLLARFRSRQEESFGAKVIAALRKEFGGHAVQMK